MSGLLPITPQLVRVKLWRAQVGQVEGVDVSRKSAGPLGLPFAPPWDLVMGSKQGRIDWTEYRGRYLQQLVAIGSGPVAALHEEGVRQGGELCLLCYCRDGARCHTTLLIEYLAMCYLMHFEVKL
jgi:hypothetical protein